MATVKTPQGEIHYHVAGEGQPLVLLRGMSFSSPYWLGYDTFLAKDFRIITIDNRGVGKTTIPATWDMTVYDMAADVIAVLDELAIDRAHIVGFSLGGMVALALALRFPKRVRAVIPVNSSIGGLWQPRLTMEAVYSSVAASRDPIALLKALSPLLVHKGTKEWTRAKIEEAWLGIQKEEGFPYVTTAKQSFAAMRFRVKDQLPKLDCPIFIICGINDRFVPIINSILIHQSIPRSKLLKIDEAGHELMLDQPEKLSAAIKEFTAHC